jgi:hypothetical protein
VASRLTRLRRLALACAAFGIAASINAGAARAEQAEGDLGLRRASGCSGERRRVRRSDALPGQAQLAEFRLEARSDIAAVEREGDIGG